MNSRFRVCFSEFFWDILWVWTMLRQMFHSGFENYVLPIVVLNSLLNVHLESSLTCFAKVVLNSLLYRVLWCTHVCTYITCTGSHVCTYIARTSARVGLSLNMVGAAMEFFPQCWTACNVWPHPQCWIACNVWPYPQCWTACNAHSSERCLSSFCALCFLQHVLHVSADFFLADGGGSGKGIGCSYIMLQFPDS